MHAYYLRDTVIVYPGRNPVPSNSKKMPAKSSNANITDCTVLFEPGTFLFDGKNMRAWYIASLNSVQKEKSAVLFKNMRSDSRCPRLFFAGNIVMAAVVMLAVRLVNINKYSRTCPPQLNP